MGHSFGQFVLFLFVLFFAFTQITKISYEMYENPQPTDSPLTISRFLIDELLSVDSYRRPRVRQFSMIRHVNVYAFKTRRTLNVSMNILLLHFTCHSIITYYSIITFYMSHT